MVLIPIASISALNHLGGIGRPSEVGSEVGLEAGSKVGPGSGPKELAFGAKDFPPQKDWRHQSPALFSDEESDDDAADLPPSSPLSSNSNNSDTAAASVEETLPSSSPCPAPSLSPRRPRFRRLVRGLRRRSPSVQLFFF